MSYMHPIHILLPRHMLRRSRWLWLGGENTAKWYVTFYLGMAIDQLHQFMPTRGHGCLSNHRWITMISMKVCSGKAPMRYPIGKKKLAIFQAWWQTPHDTQNAQLKHRQLGQALMIIPPCCNPCRRYAKTSTAQLGAQGYFNRSTLARFWLGLHEMWFQKISHENSCIRIAHGEHPSSLMAAFLIASLTPIVGGKWAMDYTPLINLQHVQAPKARFDMNCGFQYMQNNMICLAQVLIAIVWALKQEQIWFTYHMISQALIQQSICPSVSSSQALLLGWLEGPEGVASAPGTCFDFFEVFAGRQALTRTMHSPQLKREPYTCVRMHSTGYLWDLLFI